MNERFQIGDQVRAANRVYNDGSFLGLDRGDLLVSPGAIGEVRGRGLFLQDQLIYSVFFPEYGYEVGLREAELLGIDEIWNESRFAFRQKVITTKSLSVHGEVRVKAGSVGQILRVLRDEIPIRYHVNFGDDKLYLIAEATLEECDD
ncbi:nitrogen fixation protein NifZ [Celerinatantimonas sp. YJH-8]|uniref:nitrogen fixation protein NifZ n=1 Tax=Celerinatantimonas sp. YJH-8 TaxID=3228714 RepID=UPI0038C6FFA7